ncbi:MAG: outer membrane lipoprotein carrier protein LolA [Ginsengibacter sp.]
MKKLLFTLFMFTALGSFAQLNSLGKSDPDATKILNAVTNKFKTYNTIVANFTLNVESASGQGQKSESGVIYMKGPKYKIIGGGQEIFSDGKNMWTYDKSDNEVQVSKVDHSANVITPDKLFTNFYDKDYLYKLNGDSKKGTKIIQEIELTPRDKTNTFFKVLLFVDKSTKNLTGGKIFEKNGNRYNYTISSLKTNNPLAESTFVFNAASHPKVEVVDLR